MATLCNLAIGLLRLAGHTQIAPRLRWVNRNPARAWRYSASHEPANTPKPDHAEARWPKLAAP